MRPGRRESAVEPHDPVPVGHDSGEQRDTLIGVHGQKRCGVGIGYSGSQLRKFVVGSDDTVDLTCLVLPDALDGALGGKGAEDGADVGGEGRPHGQAGAGSDPGANRVDGVAREAMPSRGVLDVYLFQESGAAAADRAVQAGPEVVIARPLDASLLGLEGVGGNVQAFREQPEFAGASESSVAGPAAADVEVLVPPDVHCENVFHLQSAPGAAVAQHEANQLQPDVQRYLCSVVEVGEAAGKEPVETEAVQSSLNAEMSKGRDLRLADGQMADAGVRGERLDRLKTGRLDLAVIADGDLGAGVVPVIVTVGGVVLADAIDVGELHIAIFQRLPRKGHGMWDKGHR